MSIIDLTGRITHDASSFDDNRASDRSLLLINHEAVVESFSIELSVGRGWSRRYSSKDNGMFGVPDDGIRLDGRDSLVIEVAETLGVPFNLYGLVIPTGSLFLDRGIIIAAAKIEPSFRGKLKLRLVNTTGERHILRSGDKVASAVFFATDQTRFHADVSKSVRPAVRQPGWLASTSRWLGANKPTWIGWIVSVLTSSVAALLIATYVLREARSPAPPLSRPCPDGTLRC